MTSAAVAILYDKGGDRRDHQKRDHEKQASKNHDTRALLFVGIFCNCVMVCAAFTDERPQV